MACMIPYLIITLNIGDFIFVMSVCFSILIVLNVNKVALGVELICNGRMDTLRLVSTQRLTLLTNCVIMPYKE